MFLQKLQKKYQVTAADINKFSGEWKGKGKPGKKQKALTEIKKLAENIVDLTSARDKKSTDEKAAQEKEDRASRIRSSMSKINKLMMQLDEMGET